MRPFVTDLGIFEKDEGGLFVLTAVAPWPVAVEERVADIGGRCGWELVVARDLGELAPVEQDHVHALRRWDPQGHFLRPDA